MKKFLSLVFILLYGMLIAPISPARASVALNEANFPDPNFRSFLEQWDTGWDVYDALGNAIRICAHDGVLQNPELNEFPNEFTTSTFGGVKTLEGIALLTNLRKIATLGDNMEKLDVSKNLALQSVATEGNPIKELNVRNNTALTYLVCRDSLVKELDVSNNALLDYLDCVNNVNLTQVDVTHNPLLTWLAFGKEIAKIDLSKNTLLKQIRVGNVDDIRNNLKEIDLTKQKDLSLLHVQNSKLRTLDLTNNTALTELSCGGNQLTELDLSKNVNLTSIGCDNQRRGGLRVNRTLEGYEVNLRDYVSKPENIKIDSIQAKNCSAKLLSYDYETGIVVFSEHPKELFYLYKTHSPSDTLMDVTIVSSMNAEVIERAGPIENIIYDISDNNYLNASGNAITEDSISNLSARRYGKKGFVADGNSRLIVRVQTEKPGTVTFELKENIGVEIEKLTDRTKLTSSKPVHTSTIGIAGIDDDKYQASAVLVAPEMYLFEKFPSDDFTVHVKFTVDETGEDIPEDEKEFEEDIQLELHAAPVVLIHGFSSDNKTNCWNTFGYNSDNAFYHNILNSVGLDTYAGIYNVLKDAGFDVYAYDYRSTAALMIATDGLFRKIAEICRYFIDNDIVCTKADIVAFGFGGLVAREFCTPQYKLSDKNYFTFRSYGQGMVRRIITIATPHRGSPIASFMTKDYSYVNPIKVIIENACKTKLGFAIDAFLLLEQFIGDPNREGWKNMAINSSVVNKAFPVNVPMHALYGYTEDMRVIMDALQTGLLLIVKARKGDIKDFLLTAGEPLIIAVHKYAYYNKELDICDPSLTRFISIMFEKFSKKRNRLLEFTMPAPEDVVSDLVSIVRQIIDDVLFNGNDHDFFVSVPSAQGDFMGYSTGYSNRVHTMNLLGYGRKATATDIVNLLKANKGAFHTFEQSTPNVSSTVTASSIEAADSAITPDDYYVEKYSLTVEPSELQISDKGQVNVTVKTDTPINDNVLWFVLNNNGSDRIFSIGTEENQDTFEFAIEFTSQDEGLTNIYCFGVGNEDEENVYISNTAKLAIKPDNSIKDAKELILSDGNDAIFLDVNSEIHAGLYAKFSDGSFTNISSPLMGTLWTSSNPEIAYVTNEGLIHGLEDGTTYLTAEYAGLKTSLGVNVGSELQAPEIITESLDSAITSVDYSAKLEASGAVSISWRIIEGYLPDGLELSSEGDIYGIPKEFGEFNIVVEASNIMGSATKELELIVEDNSKLPVTLRSLEVSISGNEALTLDVGNSESLTLAASVIGKYSNGASKTLSSNDYALDWSTSSGDLSEYGMTFSNGTLNVNASAKVGTYKVSITAAATNGDIVGASTKAITVKVNNVAPVLTASAESIKVKKGATITLLRIAAEQGLNIKWSTSGELPAGLNYGINGIDNSGNEFFISGTVSNSAEIKTYNYAVTATNDVGTDTKEISIKVTKSSAQAVTVVTSVENISTMSQEELKAVFGNATDIVLIGKVENLAQVLTSLDIVPTVKNLDLSQAEVLTEVKLNENNLIGSLTITGNTSIKTVEIKNNVVLNKLDLAGSEVEKVDVKGSKNLDEVNLEGCESLRELDVSETNLTFLNAYGCKNLETLNCASCSISNLNLNGCEKLKKIDCSNNSLTRFNASEFKYLEQLDCSGQHVSCSNLSTHFNILDLLSGKFENISTADDSETDMNDLANVKDIKAYDENGREILVTYDDKTGEVTFSQEPAEIKYNYMTRFNDVIMDVTVGTFSDDQGQGSSGGGCDLGIGIIGIAFLGSVLKKRK